MEIWLHLRQTFNRLNFHDEMAATCVLVALVLFAITRVYGLDGKALLITWNVNGKDAVDRAVALASVAPLTITESTLAEVASKGFSFLETDPSDSSPSKKKRENEEAVSSHSDPETRRVFKKTRSSNAVLSSLDSGDDSEHSFVRNVDTLEGTTTSENNVGSGFSRSFQFNPLDNEGDNEALLGENQDQGLFSRGASPSVPMQISRRRLSGGSASNTLGSFDTYTGSRRSMTLDSFGTFVNWVGATSDDEGDEYDPSHDSVDLATESTMFDDFIRVQEHPPEVVMLDDYFQEVAELLSDDVLRDPPTYIIVSTQESCVKAHGPALLSVINSRFSTTQVSYEIIDSVYEGWGCSKVGNIKLPGYSGVTVYKQSTVETLPSPVKPRGTVFCEGVTNVEKSMSYVRWNSRDRTFCAFGGHLTAGDYVLQRRKCLVAVVEDMKDSCDMTWILGDLNFRTSREGAESLQINSLIDGNLNDQSTDEIFGKLAQKDEFTGDSHTGEAFYTRDLPGLEIKARITKILSRRSISEQSSQRNTLEALQDLLLSSPNSRIAPLPITNMYSPTYSTFLGADLVCLDTPVNMQSNHVVDGVGKLCWRVSESPHLSLISIRKIVRSHGQTV